MISESDAQCCAASASYCPGVKDAFSSTGHGYTIPSLQLYLRQLISDVVIFCYRDVFARRRIVQHCRLQLLCPFPFPSLLVNNTVIRSLICPFPFRGPPVCCIIAEPGASNLPHGLSDYRLNLVSTRSAGLIGCVVHTYTHTVISVHHPYEIRT